MFAIVKRNLIFSKTDEINDFSAYKVQADTYPQPLEEWVKDTLLFKLAVQDGTITLFEKPVQISVEKEEPKQEKSKK